ncbi:MAG: TIGR02300 family protein [Alkalilacustris sp.]
MPKEEWGVKRICPTTGKRFYDLGRVPIISPYSGEVVEIDLPGRKGAAAAPAAVAGVKRPAPKAAAEDDLLVEGEGSDIDIDDDLLEDEDDDNVALDDLADVADDEDDS